MVRYKMVGRDVNSFPTQYRTWVVDDFPDFTGLYYAGLKSGPEPFVDITAYEIHDDAAIVDFNLPKPLNWQRVLGTMPDAVYGSQLAIIDGYAYLFGSQASAKIWKADINNPADWIDTGATLPTTLCDSCFAIVNDRMYLFGGLGGPTEEARDTIYSAPLSNPLTWTNHGSLLPDFLHKSSLAFAPDGYIYMFGGEDKTYAKDHIWRAPLTNPLAWQDTGATLPDKLYGSTLALMGGYIVLLGGLFSDDAPTKNIYSASLGSPTTWTLIGSLPYACCHGQFVTVGDQGYLYTQAAVTISQPYETRIFRCERTFPNHWVDTLHTIPGELHQSQFGIIYDRIFAFGGNGISAIFCCDQKLKYKPDNAKAVAYGNVSRNSFDPPLTWSINALLGFPYWKTNYWP